MSLSSSRRVFVPLLLALVLLTPSVSTAGPSPTGSRPATSAAPLSVLGHLWSLLVSVLRDEGCYIDPGGRCASKPATAPVPTVQGDSGCYIDPDGRCATQPSTAPVPTVQGDTGCMIDPNGWCRG